MEIKITGLEGLADAINNVAIALSAMANLPGGTPVAEPPVVSHTEEKKKPADIQKEKIAEEIIALGGTPPEKGSVAKFQAVLDALVAEKDAEEPEAEEPEAEEPEAEEDGNEGEGDVSLEDVRTLAHALLKSTPKEPTKGKNLLGSVLKIVKAESLTKATQAQLNQAVPMIEKHLGKTLAEVLAEAGD